MNKSGDSSKKSDSQAPSAESNVPDPEVIADIMAKIADHSHKLISDFMARHQATNIDPVTLPAFDPFFMSKAFLELSQKMMASPEKLVEAQLNLWQGYMDLWQNTAKRLMGEETSPLHKPTPDDRRFKDEAWHENHLFDFIKQSYLLSSRWLHSTITDVEGLDEKTAKKIDFYTRQFVDAMAPNNFALTNPEVLRRTAETGGENLLNGLKNLLEDIEKGGGQLKIKMTDTQAFSIGKNLAITPGGVVYQNELMQLLQYRPSTEKVAKRPLLIIPPWINKFYILDMKPQNSFIKWAIDQGHTVFVISWVNPDAQLAQKSFEDYMMQGPLEALDVIKEVTGEANANVIGYCLGGTLLACTLSYLATQNQQEKIASATFFTTLVDFEDPGEISVFIDEEQLDMLEEKMNARGYLEGSEMATTFNLLRANDLIWSFVINNYLLGKEPFPFDLLYWNSDSTRLPAAMHSFYLRNMYQKNLLREPGGIQLKSTPIDLRQIEVPAFILSTREDHIAPWKSTYAATQLYRGPVTFTLAASGHIAGVINPPAANKYCHWVRRDGVNPPNPLDWLSHAEQHPGSWWPEWHRWVAQFSDGEVGARSLGSEKYPTLEEAPGSYVKVTLHGNE